MTIAKYPRVLVSNFWVLWHLAKRGRKHVHIFISESRGRATFYAYFDLLQDVHLYSIR